MIQNSDAKWTYQPPASTRSWRQRRPAQWQTASSPVVHASAALGHGTTSLDQSRPRLHYASASGPVPRRPRAPTSHPPGILRGASTWRASGLHCPTRLPQRASIAACRPHANARPPRRPQHWRDWRHRCLLVHGQRYLIPHDTLPRQSLDFHSHHHFLQHCHW
jgi:hypothetical protein